MTDDDDRDDDHGHNIGDEEARDDQSSLASSVSSDYSGAELDEEDLELIRESRALIEDEGRAKKGLAKTKKRSRHVIEDSDDEESERTESDRGGDGTSESVLAKRQRSLEGLFSEDEPLDRHAAGRVGEISSEESEEIDDFIEEAEEEEEEEEEKEKERPAKKKEHQKQQATSLWGASRHISKDAFDDLMDIFGDGSEYADLIWGEAESYSDSEDDGGSAAVDLAEAGSEAKREDRPTTLPNHDAYFAEESLWMQREFLRQYNQETDAHVIEQCLRMIIQDCLPVPFIAAFRKDQCSPLKVFHLWAIYDWNQQWVVLKRCQLSSQCSSIDNADMISEWLRKLKAPSDGGSSGDATQIKQLAANVKAWTPIYPMDNFGAAGDHSSVLYTVLQSDAVDPLVRKIEAGLVLSTVPTEAGRRLGTRHELSRLLSLQSMPIHVVVGSEFFSMLSRALSSNYCTVQYNYGADADLADQLHQLGLQRELAKTLIDGLTERTIKRLAFRLPRDSAAWIGQCCAVQLQGRLTSSAQPPASNAVCVVSASNVHDNVAVAVVKMGRSGSKCAYTVDDYGKFATHEFEKICEFIGEDGEDTIVMSAQHYSVLSLYRRLGAVRKRLPVWASDDVARVISPKTLSELFPGLANCHPLVRYCVAVGLRYLSPVDAFGILGDQELLKLDLLLPAQAYIDNDVRLHYLKRALCNVVNQRGISNEQFWLYGSVCGMSSSRGQGCKHSGPIASRDQLSAIASGFVTFAGSPNVLDGLRIARDDVQLVEKMLRDAAPGTEPGSVGAIVELVRQQPHRLLSLDLADYDAHIGGGRLLMLEEYRKCILVVPGSGSGALAAGNNAAALSSEDVFWMISGERPDRLQPGKIVRVRLAGTGTQASSAIGHLEGSGLPVRCMLDQQDRSLRKSGALNATVLSVNLRDFALAIGSDQSPDVVPVFTNAVRVSVHRDDLAEPKTPIDADPLYYKRVEQAPRPTKDAATAGPSAAKKAAPATAALPPSLLHHPAYRGAMGRSEAEHCLATRIAGDAIVRLDPALVISFRLCSSLPLFGHVPLSHDGRFFLLNSSGGSSTAKRRFEDLDEVIARGIEPNCRLLDEIAGCPKYISAGSKQGDSDKATSLKVEDVLRESVKKNPGRIAYGFWLSRDAPGTAFLSIAPHHHEVIGVEDGELVFRRSRFKSLAALVDQLKRST